MGSCTPNQKFVTMPQRTRMQFDFERGTKLKITLADRRNEFIGYVAHERTKMKTTYLEVEATEVDRRGRETYLGFMRFESEEIIKVEILASASACRAEYGKVDPKSKDIIERVYQTVVIKNEEDVMGMIKALNGVSELGLNMHGVFVGRGGQVGWISMFVEDTIICIDLLTVTEKMRNFWHVFGSEVLENEAILKVIYNARPLADFLYHKHCISLKNVFDAQVASYFNWCRGKNKDAMVANRNRVEYMKLSELLEIYLPGQVIPEELKLLQEYEKKDFSDKSPLMERPVMDMKICKYVAIDVKYLLGLKEALLKKVLCKFIDSVSIQMNGIVTGNNENMEISLKCPLRVPETVQSTVLFNRPDYMSQYKPLSELGKGEAAHTKKNNA